jgi:hypothetical protein
LKDLSAGLQPGNTWKKFHPPDPLPACPGMENPGCGPGSFKNVLFLTIDYIFVSENRSIGDAIHQS